MKDEDVRTTVRDVFEDILKEHGHKLEIKDTFVIEKLLRKVRVGLSKQSKEYPTESFCVYLHGAILEIDLSDYPTSKSVLDAILDDALVEFNKDLEWWDKVKSTKMDTKYFKNIVKHFSDHPEQVKMVRDGIVQLSDLYSGSTINQHARNLIKSKRLNNRVNDLENRVDELEVSMDDTTNRLSDLEQDNENMKDRIKHLELKVNSNITEKDWVLKLHKNGLGNKQIHSITGVHIRAIQRWIKEANSI